MMVKDTRICEYTLIRDVEIVPSSQYTAVDASGVRVRVSVYVYTL